MKVTYLFIAIFLSLVDNPIFSKPLIYSLNNRSNFLISSNNFDTNLLPESNTSDLIWTKVLPDQKLNTNDIKWDILNNEHEENLPKHINSSQPETILEKSKKLLYNDQIELIYLNLGHAVPTANTLKDGDLYIRFEQIAPIKGAYYDGGTGNQNYSASINYGLSDRLTIEGFFSHSDDPLHKKIKNYSDPVENRWINYGSAIKWQALKSNNILLSLNASVENWNVKSGGCNTFNCNSTSKNIFTDNAEEILNNNFIGSFSIPITWNVSKKLDLTLVPRSVFLPSKQSNDSSSGDFYGNIFGLGSGLEYKIYRNLKTFSSIYFPIAGGFNSFDESINYTRKPVYNAGLSYSLDTKFALEAGISNGFGMSPSIGILTLPSSDELLYRASLIYRPSNIDFPETKNLIQESLKFGGLSVSNAELLNSGEKKTSFSYDSNGSWSNNYVWGASKRMNFDLSIFSIGQKSHKDNTLNYHDTDNLNVRGGAKARFFSQNNGDLITSGARISAGRLRGWGWLHTEFVNTYSVNDKLSINISPKASFSGLGNPLGLGTSLNWEILKGISLIPEFNFAIKESTDNWTIALRYSRINAIHFDLYTTNTLSFVDTGQLIRSDNQSFGMNIGYMF
tara:strand:+ start:695 stop:2557 length:1863 start_codon:yes stop_codon:yes gene_type:complete